MLQFVIGSSGSGKSSFVFDTVIADAMQNEKENFYVIVPEQFTLQTQKELVKRHPNHGILNIDVLSFLRLSFRVFDEVGTKKGLVLEDMGKTLIVKKLLMENKDKLSYFQAATKRQGFVEEMKSVLCEFLQYGIDEEALSRMEQATRDENNSSLQRKMHDISLIYRSFLGFLEGRFLTSEGIYDLLSREIEKSNKLKNSTIVLDGFTGFTPSQYALLSALFRYAKKVYVTVTMDKEDACVAMKKKAFGKHRLFYTGFHTIETVRKLAGEAHCEIEEDILLPRESFASPYRFLHSPALSHLEKHLFRYPCKPYEKETDAIQISQYETPQKECLETVLEIKRLVRQGLRYRDCAIITGNMEEYGDLLLEYCKKAGIPAFADSKKHILGNPLVELLRSVLELSESNFSYDFVFRFLKNPLSGIEKEDCDLIENYVLSCGIRGKSYWEKEWKRLPERIRRNNNADEKEKERIEQAILEQETIRKHINKIRIQVMDILNPVLCVLQKNDTKLGERIEALRSFLFEEERTGRLLRLLSEAEAEERLQEYEQIPGVIEEIFSRAEELLSDEILSARELREMIETGLSEAKLGLVPPVRDMIILGDMERSRLSNIKALFFLGVNEGVVPIGYVDKGVLSDRDRQFYQEKDIVLAPTAKDRLSTAEYYLYLNLTKPSQRLYVSYSQKSSSGEEKRPSYFIDKLQALFPKRTNQKQNEDAISLLGLDDGASTLVSFLRTIREKGEDGTEEINQELQALLLLHKEDIKEIFDNIFYVPKDEALSIEVVKKLYGELISGSVSRLESFAACAFQYFLTYGLKLEEREVHQFSIPDLGTILHEALERFSILVKEKKKTFGGLLDEELIDLSNEASVDAIQKYKKDKQKEEDKRTDFLLDRLKLTVKRVAFLIREQLKYSVFEPVAFEKAFHYEKEGLSFYGTIDRIDLYEDEEGCYIKITDYKSGNQKLDLWKLYYGLSLQLGLYLDAMIKSYQKEKPGKTVVPVAMLYQKVQNPMFNLKECKLSPRNPEDADAILSLGNKELMPNGLINQNKKVIKLLDARFVPTEKSMEEQYKEEAGLQKNVVSDTLPIATLKNEGELKKRDSLVTEDRMLALLSHLNKKVEEFAGEIQEGKAEANPYQLGQENPCQYCSYQSLCRFENLRNKKAHNLAKLGKDEIWETIGPTTKNES